MEPSELLEVNTDLMEVIREKQEAGALDEVIKLQILLHKNLMRLHEYISAPSEGLPEALEDWQPPSPTARWSDEEGAGQKSSSSLDPSKVKHPRPVPVSRPGRPPGKSESKRKRVTSRPNTPKEAPPPPRRAVLLPNNQMGPVFPSVFPAAPGLLGMPIASAGLGMGFMNPAASVFPYPPPAPFAQMSVGFPPTAPMAAAASQGSAGARITPGGNSSAVLPPFPAPFGLPLAALAPPAPDAGTAGIISFSMGAEEEDKDEGEDEASPTLPPPPPPPPSGPVVTSGRASTTASSAPATPAAPTASTASTVPANLVGPPDAVTTLAESTSALDLTGEAPIASTDEDPGPVLDDGGVNVGMETEDVASTAEGRPRVSSARRDPSRARHAGGGSRAKRNAGHAVVPHMAILAQPWTQGESGGKITAIDHNEPVSHLGLDDLETL